MGNREWGMEREIGSGEWKEKLGVGNRINGNAS